MPTAIGLNIGAGTFAEGVARHLDIECVLFPSHLGIETCSKLHRFRTTTCSKDYLEIPKFDADCVIANAETWMDAHCAISYTVANSIDILVLDMRAPFWNKYETFFSESAKAVFREGYRTAYLFYSCVSFDTGFRENRLAFVCYKKKHNFNVTSPKLPDNNRNIFSYIGTLIGKKGEVSRPEQTDYTLDSHYELNYDEQVCLPKLERGWALRWAADKKFSLMPGTARKFLLKILQNEEYQDIYRLQWNLKLLKSDHLHIRYCHPEHDRLLTVREMMAITDWKDPPVGPYPIEQMMFGTPVAIGDWLGKQILLWFKNHWKQKDYSIFYSPKEKKFKGGNANPLRPKKYIDISEYYNESYDTTNTEYFPKKRATVLDLDDDFIDF